MESAASLASTLSMQELRRG